MVIASLLLVAAPAAADDTASTVVDTTEVDTTEVDTTATDTTSAPTTVVDTTGPTTTAVPPTSATTTTTPLPALATPSAGAVGSVSGSGTPIRGTQFQLTPPPPPPPTLPPWTQLPANSGSGRRVVYSKSQQAVWAFDANNTLIKMHRVSGKQTPYDPAPGTYRVWSRSIRTYSINNPTITWGYMVRFAKGARGGNIGFHEIPFQYGRLVQSVGQLGQALSGGCVRQALPDAQWMWNWAQLGTVVVVTP
ncbi:MAG: L,D-transpeptidase, partial [Ilumatobacteraceae bacterium]